MKRTTALAVSLFMLLCVTMSAPAQEKKKNRFQRAVDAQHEGDVKKKNELIAKMKSILGDYNKRLRKSGIKDANLDAPIDMNKMEKIEDISEGHSKDAAKPRVFGFVTDDGSIYSSSEGSEAIGRVSFAEEVEVLEKISQTSGYNGRQGQWVVVRKNNQDEGWIHSSWLSKDKPLKREEKKEDGELSFDVPASGKRTSSFGNRVDPVTKRRGSFHSGIDIAAPMGTPVKASADGTVRKTEYNKNGYGNLVIIEHAKDFTTYYGHLSRIDAKIGQVIKKGDNIGAVGSTGKSTGPHLHFEVRRGEKALDPDGYMR